MSKFTLLYQDHQKYVIEADAMAVEHGAVVFYRHESAAVGLSARVTTVIAVVNLNKIQVVLASGVALRPLDPPE